MMWDSNQSWQSDAFKAMLDYERNNDREKLIYDANQQLNAYSDIKSNMVFLIKNDDPQLLALIFSLISITHNKDDLSDYIKNKDLSEFMKETITTNDEYSSNVLGHTFQKMPEKNLDIGEQFTIPSSTLSVYVWDDNGRRTNEYDINDWTFNYDNTILSINNGNVTALKKGCTIIDCYNTKRGFHKKIKINSGNIKQSYITEFFFTQIRNIIAHGRYTLINSGSYDTLQEYGKFNMSSIDNRYNRGTQRDLLIYENNQLNVAYDKENTFNPKYLIYLAKTVYAKENNPFVKYIDIFDTNVDWVQIKQELDRLNQQEQVDYKALILLSKFYINFIYNYDSDDKVNFDYEKISIDNSIKGNHTNKEFIYEIRTAIMHGRYSYNNNEFNFWNFDKKDNNVKTFDIKIKYEDFVSLFRAKEEDFNNNMRYDPNQLIGGRIR